MIPASFDYVRAKSLRDALNAIGTDGTKVLAGGHSLIPAMKLRLAQPRLLVDIGRLEALRTVEARDGRLVIGALVTHAEIAASQMLAMRCPLLAETAAAIGDLQVRNKGTIGGSLVHADPAADWPAAILALDAELEIAGAEGRRTVPARDFFAGMFDTAVRPHEILCAIRVPEGAAASAYVKTDQKASGFALCGVAAVVDAAARRVRVGITGVAPVAYRATGVEKALEGQALDAEAIAAAAGQAASGVAALNDIHASAAYRAHLAEVNTARALARAASR